MAVRFLPAPARVCGCFTLTHRCTFVCDWLICQGRAVQYVATLQAALLTYAELCVKGREKLHSSTEFHSLSEDLQLLDAGEHDWGSPLSVAVQCVRQVFDADPIRPRLGRLFQSMRRALVRVAEAEWLAAVKTLLPNAEHFTAS